jgi:glycosyltransferase involved in cell wall biosynthesis
VFQGKTVGVVVPCHNEERLIGEVIETMPDIVDRVIVVDDLSSDSTAAVAEEHAQRDPARVSLIRHERNRGVGGAIVTGYKAAVEEGIELTAVMAGDAQMDPDDLPALLEPVAADECDYAKGNRLFTEDAWNTVPRVRYLGNSALSLMTKMVSGYWQVADSQTGYTVVNLRALETIDLDSLFEKYGFPNDMLVHLNVYDFRVMDVPIRPVYNVGEQSGIKLWKVIPAISWLLFKRFWWRLFHKYVIHDTHPLVLFYIFGMIMFTIGFILGVIEVWARIVRGVVAVPTVILAMLLIISGLQFLLFAMWFDMDYNKDRR